MPKKSSSSNVESPQNTNKSTTRKSIENLHHIDLIGNTSHQIFGAKLPSIRQVLQVMFHNIRFVKLSARQSAKLAIDSAQIFWYQARLPIRTEQRMIDRLMKIYDQWQNIRKRSADKRSAAEKKIADDFINSLDDLFDIATNNALETIKIDEDKQFLVMQRQKGRPGSMIGVDMNLYEREKRAQERKEKEEERKRKHQEESRKAGKFK